MHELSIAMSLVDEIEKILEREEASRVLRVTLQLGVLSGVEREPLETCFPMAAQGSAAEDAELDIVEIPVTVHCETCGQSSCPEFPLIECAACHSPQVRITAGKDLIIKTLEAI